MTKAQEILHYLQGQREAMLDLLSRLVLAESPSTRPEAQAVPLTLLWEELTQIGFAVRLIPGRKSGGHLLAQLEQEPGSATARQLLIGHCDTVWPIGTLQQMPLVVEDNVVRGPGVFDMKGGLTQMVFALRCITALGFEFPLAPLLFINSDEETGSKESRAHIDELAQQVERAFILEPALGLGGKLKTARKGVGRFDIVVKGKAAHAGLDPEKGVSAILGLSYIIQQLHGYNDWDKGITVNVGLIEGGVQTNVIAPQSRAQVDVRVRTREDAQRVQEAILNLAPPFAGLTLELDGRFNRPPLEPTPRNQRLWRTASALAAELGLAIEQGLAGGGSDGNYTSLYTATLDGLGAVGDGAHARHEFLYIDKMIERAALLALLLLAE